jgi:hypothetical protein
MRTSGNLEIATQIRRRYGDVIDLNKSPMLIVEIIQNYRHLLDLVAGPDGTGGAPGGSPTPPAPPPPSPDGGGAGGAPGSPKTQDLGTATVLNLLLEMKRELVELRADVNRRR